MKIRIRRTIAILGAATLMVGIAACSETATDGDQPLEAFTVVLDFVPNGEYAPLFIAQEKGWYEDVGLDVTIEKGSGSADTIKRIAAGQGDLGMADFSAVVGTRANQGVEVKAVGAYFQNSAHSFFYVEDSGISEPSDLEGKQIAISAGNSHQILFPYFAELAGFDAAKVTWVTMDAGAMGPSLMQGQVDAAPFLATHQSRLEGLAQEVGKSIGSFAFSDYGVDISALSFVATDADIADKTKSDRIKRFLAATLKGMDYVFAEGNFEEGVEAVLKSNPQIELASAIGAAEVAAKFAYSDQVKSGELAPGEFEPERIERSRDIYTKFLKLPKVVEADLLYTNELLPSK